MTGDWTDDANCKGVDPNLFFKDDRWQHRRATDDNIANERSLYGKALGYCTGCPVDGICLSTALANNERDGTWGGTVPLERKRIRRQLDQPTGRVSRQPPVHGTRSRYTGGCRCAACRTANTMYQPGAAS